MTILLHLISANTKCINKISFCKQFSSEHYQPQHNNSKFVKLMSNDMNNDIIAKYHQINFNVYMLRCM